MSVMTLKFDYGSAYKDMVDILLATSNYLIDDFHSQATQGITGETEKEDAELIVNFITSQVIFYADAIMQSFGTGSLMDRKNPYLAEYINSGRWNPERFTYTIVGRESGSYENIYGETVQSSGRMRGKDLEKKYKPISPSYSIQRAEEWLLKDNGKIKRIIDIETTKFTSNLSKYFYNVFV